MQDSDIQELQKAMQHQIDWNKKQIASLTKVLKYQSSFSELEQKGWILKDIANELDNSKKSITVENKYHNNDVITIKIDPAKSILENADEYLHEFVRKERGHKTVQNNLDKAKQKLQFELDRQENFNPETDQQLESMKKELVLEGAIKLKTRHSSKRPQPAHPRRFYTTDHVLVEVGKNSQQNDHLTLTANKDYYWMHVSELAGSHVVIHSNEPSSKAIQEAADLTAYYSKGKNQKDVPVDLLKVSQLYKPNGAKSGLVLFTGRAQTIIAHPDAHLAHKLRDPKDIK